MIVRRLLIALAVLIALTAVAAGVAPQQRVATDEGPEQVSPGTELSGQPVERTLSTRARGADRRVAIEAGAELRLLVQGEEVDSVQLGDLEVQPLDPESPATFDLVLDDPGSYPIRLLEADRTIGTLVVGEPGA
jgi:hypothetical protein